MLDVVTFGSATMDIFIESDRAHIMNCRGIEGELNLYCLKYGDKIEIDHSAFEAGGGAINTAACFAKLGLKTSAAIKIGEGLDTRDAKRKLKSYGVDTGFIMQTDEARTGFSIILTSFEGDRTVLAHRGANITLKPEDIDFEKLKKTKWIYCAPLNSKYGNVLEKITEFAEENNIKIAHNIGGKALDRSLDELKPVLQKLNILSLNTEEATKITKIEQKYTKNKKQIINDDIKLMLTTLKEFVKDIVIITDGGKGAYAYDGKNFYYAPVYPAKRVSTLGAGDAFASTFCACIMLGKDIQNALQMASINSGNVVSYYSAQEGLLELEKLEEINSKNTEYKAIIVE